MEAVVTDPDILLELEEAGLVSIIVDGRRTQVILSHPLYGETLRRGVSALRRRALLIQQTQRVQHSGARRHNDPLQMATWTLTATGTADPDLLLRAAVLARHAHDYQQVESLLGALSGDQLSLQTRLLLGEALWETGKWEQAESVLRQADSEVTNEKEKIAVTLARTWNLFLAGAKINESLAVNDSARNQIDSAEAAQILDLNEGSIRTVTGQPARALQLLTALEPDADTAANVDVWVQGAMMKATAMAWVGRASEAAAWAEHAYREHERVDTKTLAPHPASQLIPWTIALTEAGQLPAARVMGDQAFKQLTEARAPLPRIWAAFHNGRAEWLAGHLREAREWFAQSAGLARAQNQLQALDITLSYLAACAASLGDLPAARVALANVGVHPSIGLLVGEERLGEAWCHAALGEFSQARSVLTEAAANARDNGHATSEALLLTDVARLGGAKDVVGRLAELAANSQGALAPARSNFTQGLHTQDPKFLETCVDELAAAGAELLAAEAATTASAAWRRGGSGRSAAAAAHRAADFGARCAGVHTPLLTSADATSPLTPREREIAFLVTTGKSSKEIAQILALSVRTVDNHLQRVYTKLGVSSRRQLARIFKKIT
ncbi:LuxR C-terminal-related transcriptional regulator [Streptomyces sp. NPDC007355]|uniref:LuxR C-terminal-related transcriptional regulator n=1 Tax=Streptomyces sp. NPDC007355 TaxID=3364778 RepID=UPI00368E2F79